MDILRVLKVVLICCVFSLSINWAKDIGENIKTGAIEKVERILVILKDGNYLSGNLRSTFKNDYSLIRDNLEVLKQTSDNNVLMSGLEFILDLLFFDYVLSQSLSFKKDEKISDVKFLLEKSKNWPHKKFDVSSEEVLRRVKILNEKLGLVEEA